jgi:hypothetical protein
MKKITGLSLITLMIISLLLIGCVESSSDDYTTLFNNRLAELEKNNPNYDLTQKINTLEGKIETLENDQKKIKNMNSLQNSILTSRCNDLAIRESRLCQNICDNEAKDMPDLIKQTNLDYCYADCKTFFDSHKYQCNTDEKYSFPRYE